MKHDKAMSEEELKITHTPEAVRERLKQGAPKNYLKDFIYGAIDGTVTTFAVVSGVAGAQLHISVVMILGVANLVADGFSMAVSNYLGTKAETQLLDKTRKMEQNHIDLNPEGEKEEIRQIFADKGFEGKELERVVDVISSDKNRWINTMLTEEFGMAPESSSPFTAAFVTFLAFVSIGALPLLSFFFKWSLPTIDFDPFLWSSVITGFAFFIVGALKSRFVSQPWIKSGLETLFVGGMAATLAYIVGLVLRGLAS